METKHVENGGENVLMFDPEVLKMIEWKEKSDCYKSNISPMNPGEGLVLRPLSILDYDCGFLNLLSQLTIVGDVSKEQFEERFWKMKACPNTYYVMVVEDTSRSKIVGTATLVIEQKFIHGASCRARVEDVVVSEDCRGKELGKLLVDTATLLGKVVDCYKLSLECKEENAPFYNNFGYQPDKQIFMVQRFHD